MHLVDMLVAYLISEKFCPTSNQKLIKHKRLFVLILMLVCSVCLIPTTVIPSSVKSETIQAPAATPVIPPTAVAKTVIATSTATTSKEYVRQQVQAVFGTSSVMVAVASCESKFTQFNKDGSVHRGVQNPKDVGALQINEKYHLANSKKLGMDIYTLEGNLAYGKYLYGKNGTRDWNWSKYMWEKGECKYK